MVDVESMRRFLGEVKNQYKYWGEGRSGWQMVDKEGNKVVPKGCSEVNASLPGSIEIHKNGEIDMRGVYCSLVVADILNILEPVLTSGMSDFISSC